MNILFFLSPKQDLMYVYDDFTPVSYTHLDVYKRQPTTMRWRLNRSVSSSGVICMVSVRMVTATSAEMCIRDRGADG